MFFRNLKMINTSIILTIVTEGFMANQLSRVVAIHDLSGFGRCSLSVILPVLSTMGLQAVAVPTAVLSTHTGGFGDFVLRDLTDYIAPALEHYKALELEFDCIYTGFLSSVEQIDLCRAFVKDYPDALVVVDPVMGDHGKAYRTCTPELCRRMSELVHTAGVITPNLTEVYVLLGEEYNPAPISITEAKSLLVRLGALGPQRVVITGVAMSGGGISNIGYEREHSTFWRVDCDYVPVSYPGTGDIFASVLTGGILGGDSLPIAMERATRFLELAIKITYSYGTDTRWGVMLEKSLGWLTQHQLMAGYRPL